MMPRRLLIGIAAAGALAAVTPAFAAPTPVPSIDAQAAAVADSPRVEGAQARIATAQARVDAVSAQLSELRQRMVGATPEEGDALREEEARLEALKDLRVDGVGRAAEDAARIAEDERDAAGEADRQAAAPSTTGVVLAPGSLDVSATPPAADAAPPAVTSSPAVPALPAPAAGGAADAASIDAFLAAKGSPLTGLGAVFVAEAQRVGLDPRFIVAIAGAETSFGTYGPSQTIHNPFGLGPGMDFASWPEAIRYAASNLAGPLYLGRGHTTIGSIAGVWAPIGAANDPGNLNNHWTQNVGMYYAAQGGDPNAPVFTGAPAPPPGAPRPPPPARDPQTGHCMGGTARRRAGGHGAPCSPPPRVSPPRRSPTRARPPRPTRWSCWARRTRSSSPGAAWTTSAWCARRTPPRGSRYPRAPTPWD